MPVLWSTALIQLWWLQVKQIKTQISIKTIKQWITRFDVFLGSAADSAGDTAAGGANTAIEAGGTAGNTAKNTTEEVAGN